MLSTLGELSSLLGHLTQQTTHAATEVANREHGGSSYRDTQASTSGDAHASRMGSHLDLLYSEDRPTQVCSYFELKFNSSLKYEKFM